MSILSLGIDAAWTNKNPSGLCLLEKDNNEIRILNCGRSYNEFIEEEIDWEITPKDGEPLISEVLNYCKNKHNKPNCISVDMPISSELITRRRSCDNEISSAYATKGAAVHSPTKERPGKIALKIYNELNKNGYIWKLYNMEISDYNLIEVYPHTAIIEYFKLDYRYEYKVSKKNSYKSFKPLKPDERLKKLIRNLNWLIKKLSLKVENIYEYIPLLDVDYKYKIRELKGVEDLIDSIICSLVGIDYIEDNIVAYGKEDGAIWVPKN